MKITVIRHIFSFVFPILLSLYLIPLLIKAAFKLNVLDVPDGKIKNHKRAVPYLGGLAIYIPFIATISVAYTFENNILWMILGVTLLLFVGLIDDLKILKPGQKLFGQIIAVICFLKGGFSLKTKFLSDFFNLFISGFWMLSVINAFNLVDVMDGLSSLLAIVSGLTFLLIAFYLKSYSITILLLAFLAPLFVFFFYNKPSAKIYLGDAGSMYIGGFLAAIPLLIPWNKFRYDAYYAPVIILAIPLLEVFSLVIIRTWNGIAFYNGSPHHFCLYLRRKGWKVSSILIFVGVMSTFLSTVAILFLLGFLNFYSLILFGVLFLLIWLFVVFG
ncbi:MraY family glycosyltransferase [Candidatus Dependentiae bacterium]